MKEIHGHLNAQGLRFGIVLSRFNELIVKNLLAGSVDALLRHGASRDDITSVWVPGAFEVPLVAKQMAMTGLYDALICLGVVIRGATPHFDYVAGQSASGIAKIALDHDLPVLFGILTCETIEQALERSGTKCGNKGFDVAVGAIEMADLIRQIRQI